MTITKEIITDRLEIVTEWKAIQCREAIVVKEDGVEISRSTGSRHVLPCTRMADNGDGTFTHTDTDISGEPAETQAVCNAVWTDAIKASWAAHCEASAAAIIV